MGSKLVFLKSYGDEFRNFLFGALLSTNRTPRSNEQRFLEDFYCEMPKKFSKFHVPCTEMMFIADEKLISTVFRHVMFFVTQAVTS